MSAIKQFRLSWVMGPPSEFGGVRFDGPTCFIAPPIEEEIIETREGSEQWAKQTVTRSFSRTHSFIDSTHWKRSRSEQTFLDALKTEIDQFNGDLITGQEFSDVVNEEEHPISSEYNPYQSDFSDWVQSDQQRRAWKALSKARNVVESYKNSGRANLRLLDAATEEILTAESGTFLLALGQSEVSLTLNKRNFIATLDNIYRLCGIPIPDNLSRTFSKTGRRKNPKYRNKSNEPFFVKNHQVFQWNDPKGDDFGWGKITYPVGQYPKGSFDLRQFKMSWNETQIKISAKLFNLPKKGKNNVLPLVDIYIDVNRLTGAGSDKALLKRGPVLINREAAWEYAISMGPGTGSLYQAIIGGNPRKIKDFTPHLNQKARAFNLTIPRSLLRGDPSKWRVSVAVMGSEVTRAQQSNRPITILAQATQRNFGGASQTGRTAPTFIDILAETTQEQIDKLEKYKTGRKITLPYVEAQ